MGVKSVHNRKPDLDTEKTTHAVSTIASGKMLTPMMAYKAALGASIEKHELPNLPQTCCIVIRESMY